MLSTTTQGGSEVCGASISIAYEGQRGVCFEAFKSVSAFSWNQNQRVEPTSRPEQLRGMNSSKTDMLMIAISQCDHPGLIPLGADQGARCQQATNHYADNPTTPGGGMVPGGASAGQLPGGAGRGCSHGCAPPPGSSSPVSCWELRKPTAVFAGGDSSGGGVDGRPRSPEGAGSHRCNATAK